MPDENKIIPFKLRHNESKSSIKKLHQSLVSNDQIELLIGLNMVPLITPSFLSGLNFLRNNLSETWGIVSPSIHIRDWAALKPDEYLINIQTVPVVKYKFIKGKLPVKSTGVIDLEGIIDCELHHDPLLEFKILWIKEHDKETAENNRWEIIEYESIILSHLNAGINKHISSLISYDDVKCLIDIIKNESPALINEIKTAQINISFIKRILKDLLSEGIPVNNLAEILELIVEAHLDNKNISYVSNFVLTKLAERKRGISI